MKVERKDLLLWAVSIGGALAASGAYRWWVQNELTKWNKAMLFPGLVLLLVALVGYFPDLVRFFSSRGGRLGANTAVLVLAFVALLGLVNFMGYRHSKRWDWTAEQLFTLSDETKKVVGGLKQDVRIIRFDKNVGRDSLAESMDEYRRISPHVSYQVVDPDERPDIARQYEVRQMGDLVVSSGLRTEHVKEATEPVLTSAILKVTQTRQKSVCFVTGHGERSLSDNDGQGYSSVQKELERENYTVKPVNLVEAQQVPADCDVVVVAGPKTGYFPEETESLKKYLDAGGKLLLLADPATDPKLEPLLKEWNISLGNDLALGVSRAELLSGLGAAAPIVTHYGSHPITEALTNRMTFFPMARTVGAADKKNYQKPVTELLLTSERSFAKVNWEAKQKELKFEQGKDQSGPLTLGVAEEQKNGPKTARLAVFGNSAFAANAFLTQASNGDLFDNTVNWLAQDENLISIRPKTHTDRRVLFTRVQERLFFWFSLALVPGTVLVAGVVLWWKRR
jgi:ABC-type uncharacterized transport system involved in gliding motility auxiliary subunit